MSRAVNTWSCPKCGTAAFAEQNFCRKCGAARPESRRAPVTQQLPAVAPGAPPPGVPRPPNPSMSRLGLLLVAGLFVIFGGFAALVVNDVVGGDPARRSPDSVPAESPNRGVEQTTTTAPPSTVAATTTLAVATTAAPATSTPVTTTPATTAVPIETVAPPPAAAPTTAAPAPTTAAPPTSATPVPTTAAPTTAAPTPTG